MKNKEDHIKDMILHIISEQSSDSYIEFEDALAHDVTKCDSDCLVSGRCIHEETLDKLDKLCKIASKYINKIQKIK